jgi:tripartite-type tricarboxylate transporter receptor subunit TctC
MTHLGGIELSHAAASRRARRIVAPKPGAAVGSRQRHASSTAIVAAAIGILAWAVPASGETAVEFYRGKTVRIVVGYGPGSGYDAYARLLERHIGKHIPGAPEVITQNMDGAGSMRAANYLYNAAPKDGTMIGTISRSVAPVPIIGGPGSDGAKFDSSKFTWLGSLNNEVSVAAAWHTTGIKTFEDAKVRELLVGATAFGLDDSTVFPAVTNTLFGTKFKWVLGYRGGTDLNLAMERGETFGRVGWSWSSIKTVNAEWLRDGKINVLLQLSLNKHPDLPNVPLVMDLARNERERQALELIFSRQAMGRPFLAPPDLPPERAKALRAAFWAAANDPALIAEADRMKLEVNPVSAEDVDALVARMYKAPPDVIDLVKRILPQPEAVTKQGG